MSKKKKALVLAMILVLLVSTGSSLNWGKLEWGNFIGHVIDNARIWGSNKLLLSYATMGMETIYNNFVELIALNPTVEENFLLSTIMKLTIPFYVLSIVGLGFYLLFYSGSPAKRANAKTMMGKLVIGMVIITLAPQLLNLSLGFSQNLTYNILNLVNVDVFTGLVEEYINAFSTGFLLMGQISPGFAYIFPFLWLHYLAWGIFGIIAIRYIIIYMWIGLFPLTVFFYSFKMTRTLGKNMMEQTMLWSLLQCYNAIVVVGVTLGHIPEAGTITGISGMFTIDFIGNFMIIMGATAFVLGPMMATRLFRNFLPG